MKRWFGRHPEYHLHFTPTSGSWLNQVERFFAEITEKRIRRGVFRSVAALEKAIMDHLAAHDENPKPFVWTANTDLILDRVKRVCERISNSGHIGRVPRMSTQPEPEPKIVPKRRRFALSLRLLIALIAVFALGAARVVNRARNQQRVVAAIKRTGGHVAYDYEYQYDNQEGVSVVVAVPRGPGWRIAAERWLSDHLGTDYIHGVAFVALGRPRATTDEDLALVGQLDTLKDVSFWRSANITDAGLAHLRGLRRLETLSIEGPGLTDAGLAHLGGLKRLQSLQVRNCSITGPGLAALEGLTELRVLQLEGNPITDVGLPYIEGLSRLRNLSLAKCPVGDAGLTSLAKLPELAYVCLNITRVSKERAAELRRARPNLEVDDASVRPSSTLVMTPPPAVLPSPRRPVPAH